MDKDNIQDLLSDNINTEISKIKLPNNEIYKIKDEFLRQEIEKFLGKSN